MGGRNYCMLHWQLQPDITMIDLGLALFKRNLLSGTWHCCGNSDTSRGWWGQSREVGALQCNCPWRFWQAAHPDSLPAENSRRPAPPSLAGGLYGDGIITGECWQGGVKGKEGLQQQLSVLIQALHRHTSFFCGYQVPSILIHTNEFVCVFSHKPRPRTHKPNQRISLL